MANTRLESLPTTPSPPARDSLLFIERDSGGSVFVSEKVGVKELIALDWSAPLANPFTVTLIEGQAQPVDTSGGVVTVTLPAAVFANDTVYITDYTGTFGTSACTVARNGKPIMGLAENLILDYNNASVALTYIDATEGWRIVN